MPRTWPLGQVHAHAGFPCCRSYSTYIGRGWHRHQPTGPVRQGRAAQVLQAQQLPFLRAPGVGTGIDSTLLRVM